MISPNSCGQLVTGNYSLQVHEPPTDDRELISNFLTRFQEQELELNDDQTETGSYATEFRLLKEVSRQLKEDKSNLVEGELEFNLAKNRYKDILPFSHTRVVLNSQPKVAGSDYINANFIRGPSGSPRAYIACQGPLTNTLDDFWRMIWECGVSVIVMACNEFEGFKPKCELYWPDELEASQLYGNIKVTLKRTRQICPDFLVRKFSVKLLHFTSEPLESSLDNKDPASSPENDNLDNNNVTDFINNNNNTEDNSHNHDTEPPVKLAVDRCSVVVQERTICQFHYTTWPDHGAPDSVQPILELVRLMREVQPAEDRPILVHCSAGCGRTGTICCIDYVWGLLKRGKLTSSFNLCSLINDMRQQRMAMVQTLKQYILCHRAVAALFMRQIHIMDSHTYANVEHHNNDDQTQGQEPGTPLDEQHLGPVFI